MAEQPVLEAQYPVEPDFPDDGATQSLEERKRILANKRAYERGVGVSLKFPLRTGNRGFFEMTNNTIDSVKENIRILLLTKKGERVVNGSIGTNIPILLGELFEPIRGDEMTARIGAEIREALLTWMPFVTMKSIEVFNQDNVPSGTSLNPNDILVVMHYILHNHAGLEDSIQLAYTRISGV